jgi:hypothetical protein
MFSGVICRNDEPREAFLSLEMDKRSTTKILSAAGYQSGFLRHAHDWERLWESAVR